MSTSTHLVSGSLESGLLVLKVVVHELREAAVAYALRDEAIGLIDGYEAQTVVIDLQHTKFIGSVGFLAFLAIRRHLAGGKVALVNMSEPIREMFAVCRLIATQDGQIAPFETAANMEDYLRMLRA